MIFRDTDMPNVCVRLQLITGALVAPAKRFHDFFFAHGSQQREPGDLTNRELFKPFRCMARVDRLAALIGVDVNDSFKKRLAAVSIGILCDHNAASERRFVSLIIIGLDTHGAGGSAVIQRFQFIPVKSALLGIIRGAIAFD